MGKIILKAICSLILLYGGFFLMEVAMESLPFWSGFPTLAIIVSAMATLGVLMWR